MTYCLGDNKKIRQKEPKDGFHFDKPGIIDLSEGISKNAQK